MHLPTSSAKARSVEQSDTGELGSLLPHNICATSFNVVKNALYSGSNVLLASCHKFYGFLEIFYGD